MRSSFSDWVNRAVVLQVALGDLLIPLRGTVVGESAGALRFRLNETWDVDIYKSMILAVDKDNWAHVDEWQSAVPAGTSPFNELIGS